MINTAYLVLPKVYCYNTAMFHHCQFQSPIKMHCFEGDLKKTKQNKPLLISSY